MILLNNGYVNTVVIAIVVMLCVVSCNTGTDEKSKLLVKRWSYIEFKMNDEVMTGEQLENPIMEFTGDGKYKIEFGVMSEEGQWKIEADELVTTTNDNKITHIKIVKLTADTLLLHSDVEGNKAYITLVPALSDK